MNGNGTCASIALGPDRAGRPVHDRRHLREHRPLQRRERLPAGGERHARAPPPRATPPPTSSSAGRAATAAAAASPRAASPAATTSAPPRGCPNTCNSITDCIGGYYCDGTQHCAQQVAGAPCTTPDQCPSGFCTGGFCCGTSTCPSCYTCAGTGSCNFVGAGLADPSGTCTAMQSSPSSCGPDGLCDGSGGCEDYPSTTVCQSTCSLDQSLFTRNFCTGSRKLRHEPARRTDHAAASACMCDNTAGCQ